MQRWLQLGRFWHAGLAAALVVGAVLRLVWVEDMEYKVDEKYMFERSQHVGREEPWKWLGMESGVSLRNPGMSVWVFVALARITGATEPLALCRAVIWLNIAAILLVVAFAFYCASKDEREAWLWAAALVAINPVAVHFHRKIWAQSVLPFFSLLFLVCWWHRQRRWGAFAWGLIGACLGQIHMSGFFLAAGFAAWALLYDRPHVRWRYWLLGSGLGVLPMIPWFHYLATEGQSGDVPSGAMQSLVTLTFWRFWIGEPLGFGLDYPLEAEIFDFFRYPLVAGQGTYLVLVLYGLISAIGIAILIRAGLRLWLDRRNWRALWIGRNTATAFTLNAALWGYGILLTIANIPIYYHYLIVAFPLTCVWLARQALGPPNAAQTTQKWGRGLLAALWVAELLLTIGFLGYIHVNEGTPYWERKGYGPAYHTLVAPAEERRNE